MISYTPKYFQLPELVDPDFLATHHKTGWQWFDPRLLWTLDQLRERFGPATCNDWMDGGQYKWRGLRTSKCREGAAHSLHRYGRAADLVFRKISAEEIRQDILRHDGLEAYQYIRGVEEKTSWLHIDTRNTGSRIWFRP